MFYILDDDNQVQPATPEEYLSWEQPNPLRRVVNKTRISPTLWVSTVFMGCAVGCAAGLPVLFETMVFSSGDEVYCCRYCTYTEAERGHQDAVALALRGVLTDKPTW